MLFFCQFCGVPKSGDCVKEDLAKFGYQKNMKVEFFQHSSIFFNTYLSHV
jgi:hypothetical protein